MAVKPKVVSPFITLSLGSSSAPIYRQIYEGLRSAILSGQFGAQAALPSTRALAAQLGVSRLTVVSAYEQLLAEGYVEGKVGSGTYVASSLPEELLQIRDNDSQQPAAASQMKGQKLPRRVPRLVAATTPRLRVPEARHSCAFQHGMPAVDEFPFSVWSRLASRRLRNPPRDLLGYGDAAGYRPLREAVAAYLRSARAVRCDADQVIITAGTQQALYLTTQVLLDAGEAAWVEEPCYPGTRGALSLAGARIVHVPVDGEGFNLAAALGREKRARVAYVTPSHQFPLGVMMSLGRRLALLEWASCAGAWIVEDDYDSEYRYAGRPLASLQGLDKEGRVIYIGTFSKTIFPALRL
ncbi:MAG TPA: PLP-dependent aminotransferase family protein, partial [Pyrinomonadaceae bacterium]|nr:PLP-dependent aminotransferase family protein [Pyrinomonadaceae bacterium]